MEVPDIAFVSGEFLYDDFPREKQYLWKYFKTEIQQAFVRYVHVFGNRFEVKKTFTNHTGIRISNRMLEKLVNKYNKLDNAYNKAKSDMDINMVLLIEKGEFRFNAKYS